MEFTGYPRKLHFSPLVDTIGNKKPAVKQVEEVFSLSVRDLARFSRKFLPVENFVDN